MANSVRPQLALYEEARGQLVAELKAEVLAWDFDKMLRKLRQAIDNKRVVDGEKNPIRYFARHHFQMSGEGYQRLSGWLSRRQEMSVENIVLVLRRLNSMELPDDVVVPARVPKRPARREQPIKSNVVQAMKSGAIRKLIDHTISCFNSLFGLIAEAGVKPKDVLDGDRMQIRGALQRICKAFGIEVIFPETEEVGVPLSRNDVSRMGLRTSNDGEN